MGKKLYSLSVTLTMAFIFISCASPKYATVTPEIHAQFMNDLRAGKLNLNCDTIECALYWSRSNEEMFSLFDYSQWEPLAELVMKVGHGKDLAYFFLGEAARDMEYNEAALKYYKQSAIMFNHPMKTFHCRDAVHGCGGLNLAAMLPQRIEAVKLAIKTEEKSINRNEDNVNRRDKVRKKSIKSKGLDI